MRFTSVRGRRPMRGSVKVAAAAARRSASRAEAGLRESFGKRKPGSAYRFSATSHRYICSVGSGAKYAASAYASFSFQRLTKLSWQALHLRLIPRKTCALFCAACIHGVTAALVSPRQFTPTRKPSGSVGAPGLSSFVTSSSYRTFVFNAGNNQSVMLLRPAVSEKYVTPSSLRSRSFQNDIQCSAYCSIVGEQGGNECRALVRGTVIDETLELVGCRQQSPDVEIRSARKERVGHRRRLGGLPGDEVLGHEPIERRGPRRPQNRRDRGAGQRERRFPRLRCGWRRRGRAGPLIDPPPDERHLRRCQRILILRHLRLDPAGESMNEEAPRAVARPNHRTVASAVQCVSICLERQPALSLVLAVTFETAVGDDRLHLPLEIDQRGTR